MSSIITTDLGPRVSATTYAGHGETRAKVDLREAALLLGVSTSAVTKGVDGAWLDGQLVIMNQGASALSIGIRSGNTIYVIDSRLTAITV